MTTPFIPGVLPPTGPAEPALWFLFRGSKLLVANAGEQATIPRWLTPADVGLVPVRWQYLGRLDAADAATQSIHCFSGELGEETAPPPGMEFANLRALYPRLPEALFQLAGRAVQIVDWDRNHQFCSRCATPTRDQIGERSKVCPACGLVSYPRLSPAIIVRVERNDAAGRRILLARAQRFPTAMFSVLAGFVEPGETLEECVQREVHEEVGILVGNIRYFGSQPWPFPNSLMIAFVADHVAGEIVIDPAEIAAADWFTADALPDTPMPPSIANRLITTWRDGAAGPSERGA